VDQTLRRQLQQLEESEQRFRAAANTASDAIITANSQGVITDWNIAASRLFGYTSAEIVNRPIADLIPAQLKLRHRQGFEKALEGHRLQLQGKPVELRGLTRGGQEVEIELALSRWKAGGEKYFTSIIRDISERKQSEKRLAESEERFRTLVVNDPEGVFVEYQGRFAFVNPGTVRIFAAESSEQLIGKKIMDFIHPANREYAGRRIQELLESGGSPAVGTAKVIRLDGELIRVEMTASRISWQGQHAIQVIARDVTERLRTEEQLRKLSLAVEQSPSSVLITDTSGTIEYINPKFCEVSGYTPEELIGQTPRIMQSGNTPQETYQELWSAIQSGREWRGEINNRKKNGELIWEHMSISPIKNKREKITHFLAVIRRYYRTQGIRIPTAQTGKFR